MLYKLKRDLPKQCHQVLKSENKDYFIINKEIIIQISDKSLQEYRKEITLEQPCILLYTKYIPLNKETAIAAFTDDSTVTAIDTQLMKH